MHPTFRGLERISHSDLGHDWPSKTMNIDMAVAGVGPQPIEANDIVIDFFDNFSLQG